MKKQIILTAAAIAATILTNAQDRFTIGLRTGVNSTFHLKAPNYPQNRNHIGYNAAVSNQLFGTYHAGKNRRVLVEASIGYTQRRETSEEQFSSEQALYPITKIKTEKLKTVTPSIRISYRVAQMKTVDWKHYAGISVTQDLDFYSSKMIGNPDIVPDYENEYNAETLNGGIHYNGIIGITKKISVNYLFSVTTYLGYTIRINDTRTYNYNGMFGLSYKL